MKSYDYVGKYWVSEIIKIAKSNNYKYAKIWAVNYYEWLDKDNDYISVELIKRNMSYYYNTHVICK